MFARIFSVQSLFYFCLSIQNVFSNTYRFLCPKDGRWPHPLDCERYFTCNGSVAAEGWCGNGMTFDVDHERCDLSKNIDCKHGERPNWKPPEGWQTETISERAVIITITTTVKDQTETEKQRQTTLPSTTLISTRFAHSRMLSPLSNPIENTPCLFPGNLPDPNNCQSYFTCKDDVIVRLYCPDKHLFDEDLRSCNDYRKVFCGNRPSHEHGDDPCLRQPNGWYPDYVNHCRSYYLCTEQRKIKMGECPIGSKWNVHRLRCDDPRYISAPCGIRRNSSEILFSHPHYVCLIVFNFIAVLISFPV